MGANKNTAIKEARRFASQEKERIANEHRLLRRLSVRERLQGLLKHATESETQTERELRRLKEYLLDWKAWTEAYKPNLGYLRAVPYLDLMRPSIVTDHAEILKTGWNTWAMRIVDTAINEDLPAKPNGQAMRVALRSRLLNESAGVRVFRHGTLVALSLESQDELADQAEEVLVPIVKAKHLPL